MMGTANLNRPNPRNCVPWGTKPTNSAANGKVHSTLGIASLVADYGIQERVYSNANERLEQVVREWLRSKDTTIQGEGTDNIFLTDPHAQTHSSGLHSCQGQRSASTLLCEDALVRGGLDRLESDLIQSADRLVELQVQILNTTPCNLAESIEKLKFIRSVLMDGTDLDEEHIARIVDETITIRAAALDRTTGTGSAPVKGLDENEI